MFNKMSGVNKLKKDCKEDNKIIILNWKMNPVFLNEAESLWNLVNGMVIKKELTVVVCPPFPYFPRFTAKLKNVVLGAQDCFWENKGPYTGEISPLMIKNLGVKYVILGHSERRENLNETDEMINKKITASLKAGLKTVFCVGEKTRDEKFAYLDFLKEQIEKGLKDLPLRFLKNLIVAYEPVWAISSAQNAEAETADDLLTTSIFIRKALFNLFNAKKIFEIPILYGGSVDKNNFKKFLNIEGISGILVGGASINKKELCSILKN